MEGIRVVDLSRVIAGPHCTMILGDLGAEVIKVEKQGTGDISREFAPFFKGESTYFMAHNRNKSSITMNFRNPKAHDLLFRLLEKADVLVENFRAGTLERMGFNPNELLQRFPQLIITRISGFGQTGPYAKRACFDAAAQAMSGIMDITGFPDGPPTMVGTYVCDMVSGVYAALGTIAAIQARNHTHKGQVVDISLFDAACGLTHSAILNYHLLGEVMQRTGNQDRASWPASFYPTLDGKTVFIHAGTDQNFEKLCKICGHMELLETELKNLSGRRKQIEICDALVSNWTKEFSLNEIIDTCEFYGIPCAPVNDIEQMANDPQLKHRGMIQEVEDSKFGRITMNGPVLKMSHTTPKIYRTAPRLGEDNFHIYHGILGLSANEITSLEENGVI